MSARYYYLGPYVEQPETLRPGPVGTVGMIDLRNPEGTAGVVFYATDAPVADGTFTPVGPNDGTRLDAATLSESQREAWASMVGTDGVPAGPTLLDVLWQTLTEHADPDGQAMCLPLMPTHKGILELHLGGHSLIRSRRFRGEADPAWPKIRALTQRSYRRARQRSRGRNVGVHLKYLEAMRRKLRVKPEQLVPADLPFEGTRKPTTTLADDFNRSDGDLDAMEATVGSVGQGWSWVVENQTFAVSNNEVRATGGSTTRTARADVALSSDDQRAKIARVDAEGPGGATRCDEGTAECYSFCARGSDTFTWRANSSGARTNLDFFAAATGDLTLESDGSSHSVYEGETLLGTSTDSNLTGNLYVGLGDTLAGNRDNDDFEGGDFVAAEPPTANIAAVMQTMQRPSIGAGHGLG